MPNWSPNNRAHTRTWFSLHVLGQHDLPFAAAADLRVDRFTFWSATASQALRNQQAEMMGIQLDNMFRDVWLAQSEPGVAREDAVHQLQSSLMLGETTMNDLGEVADRCYRFLGEVDHA